jgi:hypothetical protein
MIRPSPSRIRPFAQLAVDNADSSALLQAERDATSVLLNDWTHDLSDTVFARYFETGAFPHCVDSILANGYGRVQCLPDQILQAGTGLGIGATPSSDPMRSLPPTSLSMESASMSMSGMPKRMAMDDSTAAAGMSSETMMMSQPTGHSNTLPASQAASSTMTSMPSMSQMASMSDMSMSGMSVVSGMSQPMTSLSPRGCTPPMMFREGFDMSSLPPETCTNTTASLLTIPANLTQGWLALNLVNSGSVSALRVSLDGHSMCVYAADGLFVTLQEVKASNVWMTWSYID